MFKLLTDGFKLVVFGVMVLAIGSVIEWKGRSISRHVEDAVSSAEQSRLWASTRQTVAGAAREISRGMGIKGEVPAAPGRSGPSVEQITVSERTKLRDLIRDLNSGSPETRHAR